MEFNRAQLKQRVRQAMRGQRPRPMLITLLFTIIVSIGTQIVNGILGAASGSNAMTQMYAELIVRQQREPLSAIQYILVYFGPQQLALALSVGFVLATLITTLWTDFMGVGYSKFCLGMARGEQPQTDALFSHFPQWGSVLLTQLLAGVFRALWELLLGVGLFAVLFGAVLLFGEIDILLALVVFAAYIAYSLGVKWVTLRYAMVDFLIADQGLTGMDAIRESKRLVREKGNTGRLFILKLSFIGWYLVECAVILAACLMGVAIFGAGIAAAHGLDELAEALAVALLGCLGLILVVWLILAVFNLWLTPYITGARALFYDWARGAYDTRPADGFGGGQGGWGQPADYTRTTGPASGRGIGPGAQNGTGAPRPPKPPRDDPWN
ncbi:MAG: DUF975 family protein [Oscillospiraceae bacterium]|nr:DUF975 family protein [Oscillospiraceae bacterium]MDE7170887.1 DUF975 family protein [Oscillospiraceae bacterium]